MTAQPSIFRYLDYRQYLADWVESKRNKGKFSFRGFALKAGFRSHEVLKLVMHGRRNLSVKSIHKFSHGMSLTQREAKYFETLVLMNQAATSEERLLYYRRLVANPSRQKAAPLEKSQLRFFEHWLTPVLFEMLQLPGFRADPAWIASQIRPEPSLVEIKQTLNALQSSGFVDILPNGRWIAKELQLASGHGVNDVHLFAYHQQALAKAADALHDIPSTERFFNVFTTAVPKSAVPKLFAMAQSFEEDVKQCIAEEAGPMEDVVQISFQLFRILTKDGSR